MTQRLAAVRGYRSYFKEAFGTEEITDARVAQAIADYVRTRVSGNSAYDRFNAGDNNALSPAARLGDQLFFEKARCGSCHLGENFTGGVFQNLGIGWDPRTQSYRDEGRFLVTKDPRDRGAFKTPGLRDVNRRAPYMHDGSLATLRDVVQFYNRGRGAGPNALRLKEPLGLTDAEVTALVELPAVAGRRRLSGHAAQDLSTLISTPRQKWLWPAVGPLGTQHRQRIDRRRATSRNMRRHRGDEQQDRAEHDVGDGIERRDAKQQCPRRVGESDRKSSAAGDPHDGKAQPGMSAYQRHDRTSVGAKRYTQRHFRCTAAHIVRHHAVNSDDRENDRNGPEQPDQPRGDAAPADRIAEPCVQRPNVIDRK